ncbi:MAG: hypothetical protein ACI9QL_004738 [Candidatus Omnitrophota bacterium]|jgi:hypothetical protein
MLFTISRVLVRPILFRVLHLLEHGKYLVTDEYSRRPVHVDMHTEIANFDRLSRIISAGLSFEDVNV